MSPSQDRLERLVPHMPADGTNPFASDVRHPATPVVLDAIDTGRELRERPVSVLCPGCGDVLAQHRDGLPLRVARVEAHCETCATTLQRWAVVAIGTAYELAPSPAQLRDTVTDYWDEHLWAGITTGEDNRGVWLGLGGFVSAVSDDRRRPGCRAAGLSSLVADPRPGGLPVSSLPQRHRWPTTRHRSGLAGTATRPA
jgi:hypothetical protein